MALPRVFSRVTWREPRAAREQRGWRADDERQRAPGGLSNGRASLRSISSCTGEPRSGAGRVGTGPSLAYDVVPTAFLGRFFRLEDQGRPYVILSWKISDTAISPRAVLLHAGTGTRVFRRAQRVTVHGYFTQGRGRAGERVGVGLEPRRWSIR